jgi:four helix bundle protein
LSGEKVNEHLDATGEVVYDTPDGDELWVGEPTSGPVREKSFQFSLAIIRLYKMMQDQREFVVSKQLLRSGTSIGANVEEGVAASSRRDFLHKMTIASKEARETAYWLRLLDASDLVEGLEVQAELKLADELVRLLTAIVKTTKGRTS